MKSQVFITTVIFTLLSSSLCAKTIYVSPKGSDSLGNGSSSSPFKTAHKAKDVVRKLGSLKSDVSIVFKDGIHFFSKPLYLTKSDSGRNGFKVIYKAENPMKATLSAGMPIRNWQKSSINGVWVAKVPVGTQSRQLYVNGRRAVRARSKDGKGWQRTATGYTAPAGVASWENQQDIELVFGYRWKMNRGRVKSVSGTQATLQPGFWKGTKIGPFSILDQKAKVSWVENNLGLLDEAGEWYLDSKKSLLYYKPLAGEKLQGSGAVQVIIPRLETLIAGFGVMNLRFEGLKFSHATWLRPNQEMGYLSVQAGVTMNSVDYINIEDAFEGLSATPGNVRFKYARNIVFAGNKFEHLGAAGLSFDRGSQRNTIFNNHFTDISASAIVISNPNDHHEANPQAIVKDTLIDNNLVEKVAVEFDDNPAIISLWAERTVVTNNTIKHVPYSGISVGWGWGRYDVDEFQFTTGNTGKGYSSPTVLKNTLVLNNLITHLMLVRHDGGGIYNLSSNLGARVTGNVISHAHDLNGAVYLDDGSRGIQIDKNVTYAHHKGRKDFHIKGAQFHVQKDNDLSGGKKTYNPSFKPVVEAAGRKSSIRERSIESIVNSLAPALELPEGYLPASKGLVIGKPVQASVNSAHGKYVVDGKSRTYWFAGKGKRSASLIVDLKESYDIGTVTIAFGRVDSKGQYKYIKQGMTFSVQLSQDARTWQDATLFTMSGYNGSKVDPTTKVKTLQGIYNLLVKSPAKARFVRFNILDSDGQDFGVLRIKVDERKAVKSQVSTGGQKKQKKKKKKAEK